MGQQRALHGWVTSPSSTIAFVAVRWNTCRQWGGASVGGHADLLRSVHCVLLVFPIRLEVTAQFRWPSANHSSDARALYKQVERSMRSSLIRSTEEELWARSQVKGRINDISCCLRCRIDFCKTRLSEKWTFHTRQLPYLITVSWSALFFANILSQKKMPEFIYLRKTLCTSWNFRYRQKAS